jgi:hypothetical protein
MAAVAFKLRKAEFTQSAEWNYEDQGTLAQNCKGLTLKFGKKNLASDKRVVIFAYKGDDDKEPMIIPCSEGVSKSIRKALPTLGVTKTLASLVGLSIQQNKENEEMYFLMAPMGEQMQGAKVSDLVKQNLEYEDLLALA